jgi:hypothetical protein
MMVMVPVYNCPLLLWTTVVTLLILYCTNKYYVLRTLSIEYVGARIVRLMTDSSVFMLFQVMNLFYFLGDRAITIFFAKDNINFQSSVGINAGLTTAVSLIVFIFVIAAEIFF